MKFVDLTGSKFGRLTVIKQLPRVRTPKGVSQVKYLCRCDCGNEIEVFAGNLRKQNTMSCGCLNKEKISKRRLIDLAGKRFGRLTVVSRAENYISPSNNMSTMWNCVCSCGKQIVVNGGSLKQGRQISCGCYLREKVSSMMSIDISGQKFGKLTAIEPIRCASSNRIIIKWKCKCECGNTAFVSTAKLRTGYTKSCGCLSSVDEMNISSFLRTYEIEFKTQYSFPDLKGPNGGVLFFDFALFDGHNLIGLIEFQGKQHYSETGPTQFGKYQREITDPLKRQYCIRNNIPLFEIKYDADIDEEINKILYTLYDNSVPSSEQSEKV